MKLTNGDHTIDLTSDIMIAAYNKAGYSAIPTLLKGGIVDSSLIAMTGNEEHEAIILPSDIDHLRQKAKELKVKSWHVLSEQKLIDAIAKAEGEA